MSRSRSRRSRRSTGSRPPVWALIGLAVLAAVTLVVVGRAVLVTPEPTEAAPATSTTAAPIPTPDVPEVALFIGDSYTAGAGATGTSKRWSSQLALRMGWFESNEGFGGIGSIQSRDGQNYLTRADNSSTIPADVVVVSGGRNDVRQDPAEVGVAVDDLLARLAAAHPEARIVVLSPWWDDDPAPESFAAVVGSYRGAAERAGVAYIETGQPLADRPELLSDDGVHPNDAGHLALAEASHAAISAAGLLSD